VSKYASEHYLNYYRHQHGIEYLTLRYANVYGPRQIPHGEAGVVAIFMNNLLAGKRSFVNHFPEEEKGMVRDYCFVGDVVKANLAALRRGSCEAVNIGTGVETRTLTLYDTVYSAVKERLPEVPQELAIPGRRLARPGDLSRSCLVVARARDVLGWEPTADLKYGIGRTLEWRLADSRK
jgi:UDP-glucose 4-epimerase